jgi:hypothetical protein
MKENEDNIKKCKEKIQKILDKYDCRLISADEFTVVLVEDKRTEKTSSMIVKGF